jgi:hypothetical protein
MPPPSTAMLAPGDCLFVFGNAESINKVIGDEIGKGAP